MGGGRTGSGGETGQASVEWVGIVLAAALALGALGVLAAARAGGAPASDRDVGTLVAKRLVCAARGSCAAGGGRAAESRARPAGSRTPQALALPAAPSAAPPASRRPPAGPSVPSAGPSVPPALPAAPTVPRVPSRARAIEALRRLRVVGATLVKRAWIVCIGYRRFRYELAHPRAPNEAMPLDEALDIANGCLNPYAFLVEDG